MMCAPSKAKKKCIADLRAASHYVKIRRCTFDGRKGTGGADPVAFRDVSQGGVHAAHVVALVASRAIAEEHAVAVLSRAADLARCVVLDEYWLSLQATIPAGQH